MLQYNAGDLSWARYSSHLSRAQVPTGGNFLFAAGSATGRLASYRINGDTGALTPLAAYAVGQRPMAVLATRLGA